MGPSIAAGSHMCMKNWADLPIAAIIRPSVIRVSFVFNVSVDIISHVPKVESRATITKIKPMSPIRL